MMYECVCHQVSIVGGDANKLAYQKAGKQLNSSYSMSTCQFWTDRKEYIHFGLLFEERVEDQQRYEYKTVPLNFLIGLEVSP